jgi:uncharacterized protein (DUF2062 family)
MTGAPSICVVIPVYNHGLTVQNVVRGAKTALPVIVVNDGATDATPAVLAAESGITVVTLPYNQGKAAALRAGFALALELGFTHAITLDSDGQHSPGALPDFAAACRRQPNAFIIGVRDFKKAGAPFARRACNALSTVSFKFETGLCLADTQCGYRCYPLALLAPLRVVSGRYAYELEILVKAAWAGVPLVEHPIEADYAAPTSQLSHFHPWRDMAAISWLHSKLSFQAFFVPPALRRLAARGLLRSLPPGPRIRTALRHLFSENAETPARLAAAVGLGLFCGIAPIWGLQMAAAALLAQKFRLNKAIAITASNVSFGPIAPLVLASGLILGHLLWTGRWVDFSPAAAARQVPAYLCEWVLGSVVLAVSVAALGAGVAYLLARWTARAKPVAHHD